MKVLQEKDLKKTHRSKRDTGFLLRFWRNTKGSFAIEFSMLALPFFLLVFVVIEATISFAAQQVLTNVADDIARQLRTGQIRTANLRNMVCARLEVVVPKGCPDLEIDLRTYDTFAQAAAQNIEFTENGDIDTSKFKLQLGGAGDKNQLRLFYRWPVILDIMSKAMSTLPEGKTLHFASVTWQNEQFKN